MLLVKNTQSGSFVSRMCMVEWEPLSFDECFQQLKYLLHFLFYSMIVEILYS